MTIRAGHLRHRVEIQQRIALQSSSGAASSSWVTFATRRASVEPKVGRETATGIAKVITTFRMRAVAGLLPSMRVVWNGKVFDITSIQDVKALHREMIVMTDELIGTRP